MGEWDGADDDFESTTRAGEWTRAGPVPGDLQNRTKTPIGFPAAQSTMVRGSRSTNECCRSEAGGRRETQSQGAGGGWEGGEKGRAVEGEARVVSPTKSRRRGMVSGSPNRQDVRIMKREFVEEGGGKRGREIGEAWMG
jgi:hypothetical protein